MASTVRSIDRAKKKHAAKEAAKGEVLASINELFRSQSALLWLTTERLPATLAFRLSKIAKAVTQEIEAVDETRIKLCQQYGTLNEETKAYDFPTAEVEEKFNQEWAELSAVSVAIKGGPISIGELQGITISAGSLMALSWLVVD